MSDRESNTIHIESGEEPRPLKIKPPPDYASRSVQIRIFILVAALMLVFVLMREAGKPENWAWMGFESPVADDRHADDALAGLSALDSTQSSTNHSSADNPANLEEPRNEIGPALLQGGYQEWRRSVWLDLFQHLDVDQRRQWFSLLMMGRGRSDRLRDAEAPYSALLDELEQGLKHRWASDWDQFRANAGNDADALATFSSWTVSMADLWTTSLRPSLQLASAGIPSDSAQKSALEELYSDLAPTVWRLVEDHTQVARPAEGPAALVAWDMVLSESSQARLPRSTVFELLSSPTRSRGTWFHVDGELRLVEAVEIPANDLGIDRFFALWIRPGEWSRVPYCVYALEWPAELPPSTQRFTECRVPISLDAVFFKVRTYLDSSDQVAECPLLFAKSSRVTSTAVVSEGEAAARWPWLTPLLAVAPIIAAWIAWRVYLETGRVGWRRSPWKERAVAQTLDELKSDPGVQTPRERIAQWEREQRIAGDD